MLNALIARLEQKKGEYRYLLVDPLANVWTESPLYLETLKAKAAQRAAAPVLRADLSYRPDKCPHLVLMAGPGEDCDIALLRRSLSYSRAELLADKRYICGWLTSALAVDELAEFMRNLCTVLGNFVRMGYSLPYFEPLRLALLQETCRTSWLRSQLSSIADWSYLTITEKMNDVAGSAYEKKGHMGGLAIQAQLRYQAISRLLIAWARMNKRDGQELPQDAVRLAAEQIMDADRWGLTNLEDVLAFSLNRLTVHPHMENHPLVAAAIRDAAANDRIRLTTKLNELPEFIWTQVEQMPR